MFHTLDDAFERTPVFSDDGYFEFEPCYNLVDGEFVPIRVCGLNLLDCLDALKHFLVVLLLRDSQ